MNLNSIKILLPSHNSISIFICNCCFFFFHCLWKFFFFFFCKLNLFYINFVSFTCKSKKLFIWQRYLIWIKEYIFFFIWKLIDWENEWKEKFQTHFFLIRFSQKKEGCNFFFFFYKFFFYLSSLLINHKKKLFQMNPENNTNFPYSTPVLIFYDWIFFFISSIFYLTKEN